MEDYVWVVCYLNLADAVDIEANLAKKYRRYMDIEVFIPTIRVLTKTFKRKDEYQEVPLLLNYGFIKVPRHFIYNDELMRILKRDVKAIFQFLKNPSREDTRKKRMKKIPVVATVTQHEIDTLVAECKNKSAYSQKQADDLKPGQIVTLRTYPFDGVLVEISQIDPGRKQAKVKILSDMAKIAPSITISFDHLFYTIYNSSITTPGRESSLDEMLETGYSIENLLGDESIEP